MRTITPESLIEMYYARGLTQAQIAKEWDMSQQDVSMFMRFFRIPTRRDLARRAKDELAG